MPCWMGCIASTSAKGRYRLNLQFDNLQFDYELLFDKAAVKEAAVHYSLNSSKVVIAPLFEYEGAIYGFSRGLYNEAISMPQFLVVTLNDGSREDIQTNGGTLTFEKGRYYLYSGMKGNFLLPRMEAGVF